MNAAQPPEPRQPAQPNSEAAHSEIDTDLQRDHAPHRSRVASRTGVNSKARATLDDSHVRTIALVLLALSLAWAVWTSGGVWPAQWEWSALGITLAACMTVSYGILRRNGVRADAGIALLAVLAGWMIFQLVPLPPAWVKILSPRIWSAAATARIATGQSLNAWLPLSVAPASTLERLLDVIPAMAAFVAARELGARVGRRMWRVLSPILAIAVLEALLGLVQFGPSTSPGTVRVSGTYVNPNHFAGLLEMVFPLGIAWAAARWKRGYEHRIFPANILWQVIGLLGVSALLMAAVFASLSRMAVIAMLASLAVTLAALLAPGRSSRDSQPSKKNTIFAVLRWVIPVGLPVFALAVLSPVDAILRFASSDQFSGDGRLGIWRDTIGLIRAYPWTGCGLGAFERGLYPFRTFAPNNTVDFAHNDYLQIVAELGWPGALVAGGLGAWILWSVLRVVVGRRESRNWEVAVGVLGALVAIAVHSLTDFNLYIPANAFVLAWIAGVGVSPAVQERSG